MSIELKNNRLIASKTLLLAACLSSCLVLNGCVTALVGAAAGTTGALIGSDSRTVNEMATDENIEQNIWDILRKYQDTNAQKETMSLDCVSMSGNVLLIGETTRQNDLNAIIAQIKQVNGVSNIYNYVENRLPVSVSVTANDSWITSKVKNALLWGKDISSGRFKVYTQNSRVFLMGYVTRDEAQRAINQTLKVDGVSKIYTIFDYMDKSGKNTNVQVINGTSGSGNNTRTQSSSLSNSAVQSADNGGAVLVGDEDLLAPSAPAQSL